MIDAGGKIINPAYAYDAARNRLVVFGGADYASSNIASNDVWFVDLSNPLPGSYGVWTKQAVAGRLPLPRKNASAIVMNGSTANPQFVVFGGYVVNAGGTNGDGNDAWALSLSGTPAWKQLCPAGALPQNRMFPAVTLVTAENALGLWGGWTSSGIVNYGKGGNFFNYDDSFWELSPKTAFDDGTCPWRYP